MDQVKVQELNSGRSHIEHIDNSYIAASDCTANEVLSLPMHPSLGKPALDHVLGDIRKAMLGIA